MEKLKDPIEDCFNNVFQYIDYFSGKILEKTFTRFPQAVNDMTDLVTNYLVEERDKTKYIVDSVVDMEINYLFTNDKEYLENFTAFIPKHQRPQPQQQQMGNNNMNNKGQNQGQGQMQGQQDINEIKPQKLDAKKLFIKEIRNRIEAYFKLIVRNLRDMIPKIMGNYLIKEIEENMQLKLYNKLYNAKEMTDLLNEPESVAERRKELNDMIKVMRKPVEIIVKEENKEHLEKLQQFYVKLKEDENIINTNNVDDNNDMTRQNVNNISEHHLLKNKNLFPVDKDKKN